MKKGYQICSECLRKMERCRIVAIDGDDPKDVVYVCRQCWRDLDYDKYMYEHREKGYGHGV